MAQAAAAVIQVGIGIGLEALQRDLQGKTRNRQPRIKDMQVTQSQLGAAIPEIFGVVRMGANLIWAGPVNEVKNQRTQSAKGLGPPAVATTTFKYFGNFAFSIGQGPVLGIRRVWADKKVIYDASGDSAQFFKYPDATIRFYPGSETQDPDPLMESTEGDFAPAHRGLAYMVFEDFPLADFGDRIPQMEFEVSSKDLADSTIVQNAEGIAPSSLNRNSVVAIPSLRKLYFMENDDDTVIVDMDTGLIEKNRDKADPDWIADIGDGGFGSSKFTVFGLAATPTGRLFAMGDADLNRPRVVELNPQDLSLIDHGVSVTATGNTAKQSPIGHSGDMFIGCQISTFAGPATGCWLMGDGVALNDPAGSCAARFFWVDKAQALGWFRQERQELTADGTEATAGLGKDGWNAPMGGFVDNEGALWVLIRDYTRTSKGSNVDYRANLIKFKADITTGAVPIFGPKIDVETEVFDLTAFDIHCESGITTWSDAPSFAFDKTTGYIFIIGSVLAGEDTYEMIVWDPRSETKIRGKQFSANDRYWLSFPMMTVPVSGGKIIANRDGAITETALVEIDFETFEVTDIASTYLLVDVGITPTGLYAPEENTMFHWENTATAGDLRKIALDRIATTPETLEDVIRPQFAAVGFDGTTDVNIDASLLSLDVSGFGFPGTFSAREALTQLAFAYSFDIIEQDAEVSVVPRGATSVVVVPTEAEGFGRGRGDRSVAEVLLQTPDLPARVDVVYPDPAREHLEGQQYAARNKAPFPTQYSDDALEISVLVEMPGDQAAQLAEVKLYSDWASRLSFKTTLTPEYLKYLPSDLINLTRDDGTTVLTRIEQQVLGAGFTSEIEVVEEDPDVYLSVSGGIHSGVPIEVIDYKGPTKPLVLDIPLLRDSDNSNQSAVSVYSAMGAYTDSWDGATMQSSTNNVSFTNFDANDTSAAWGFLKESLPPHRMEFAEADEEWVFPDEAMTWDHVTTLTCYFIFGGARLGSITEEQVLNGLNAFAVGEEIIQAATIVAGVEDNEFILSDLLRGRRGTEQHVLTGHATGSQIVCLDSGTLGFGSFGLGRIGTTVTFQAESNNAERENASDPLVKTLEANSLKPFAPTNVKIDPQPFDTDGTTILRNGSITISAVPRSRLNGNDFWTGNGDVPNSETVDEFEIVILNKANGSLGGIDHPDIEFRFDVVTRATCVASGSTNFTGKGFLIDDLINIELEGSQHNQGQFALFAAAAGTTANLKTYEPGEGSGDLISKDTTTYPGRVYTVEEEALSVSVTAAELEAGVVFTTADWQTTAGYSNGDYIDIVIYQKSGKSAVGRGFPFRVYA